MEVYLRELAAALAAVGHDVRVATRFARDHPPDTATLHVGSEDPRRYSDDDVTVAVLGTARGRGWLMRPVHRVHFHAPRLAVRFLHAALGPSLRRALLDADVVHYSGTGRELLGFVARREAVRLGVPFVVTPHTHEGHWGDGALDLDLYRSADRVVALTLDERRRLTAAGVSPTAIDVVGHGVSVAGGGDGASFRATHGLGDAPVVLFLGRKTPDKGFDLLLESAPALWSRVPDARVVLAGTGGAPRALPPSAMDPRVLTLGRLDDAEREDAYAACDVFALPSEAEAFGLVVLEAWSYAKPVVASDIPTLRERLARGGGIAVARNPEAMGLALARVLADAGLRQRLGQEGQAAARFATWERAATAMTALYERAGAGP